MTAGMSDTDDLNEALNAPDLDHAIDQAIATDERAPGDGQIDLFTGGPAETTEYGARVHPIDDETRVIGPVRTIEGAERAGHSETARYGGTFEVVTRRVTAWEPLT